MKISKRGLDELIKPHEGYHDKEPDGSCKAYSCPAGKLTCGWGCTEGVTHHTHWTKDEAEAALAKEMAQHEANVEGLVKVPLDQGQFDALVSLCYNIGAGNLKSSSLLRHLNSGDYARAASHFADWKYATVANADTARIMKVKVGAKCVLPGLVERRANEATMFLLSAPLVTMPQAVAPPRVKFDLKQTVRNGIGAVAAGGVAVRSLGETPIPAVPPGITDTLTNLGAWSKLLPRGDVGVYVVGACVFGTVALAAIMAKRFRA